MQFQLIIQEQQTVPYKTWSVNKQLQNGQKNKLKGTLIEPARKKRFVSFSISDDNETNDRIDGGPSRRESNEKETG